MATLNSTTTCFVKWSLFKLYKNLSAILYYKTNGAGNRTWFALSYDIIKAHGGELKVETIEGEGAEFIIYLPFK